METNDYGSSPSLLGLNGAAIPLAAPRGGKKVGAGKSQRKGPKGRGSHGPGSLGPTHIRGPKHRSNGVNSASSSDVSINHAIAQGMNEYTSTAWYAAAVKQGFKNQAALDRFNATVGERLDEIDPRQVPVCADCGRSDAQLCSCSIVNLNGTVEVINDDALAIPIAAPNIRWRFDWVDQVKRMFIWPRFDNNQLVNHNIGWLGNNQVPEDVVWGEMLCFIRLKMNTTYKVNGVDDRAARLAHAKKLAQLFLDTNKVPLRSQLDPAFVNRVHHTIQKATDQNDDNFMLAENNEEHSWLSVFQKVPWRLTGRLGLAALAIAYPRLVASLGTAVLTVLLTIWRQFHKADSLLIANGSVLVLRSILSQLKFTTYAFGASIWNGLVMPCYTAIQQWLCRIAGTISWSHFSAVTSAARLSLPTSIGN
jgi:hypothetical protein